MCPHLSSRFFSTKVTNSCGRWEVALVEAQVSGCCWHIDSVSGSMTKQRSFQAAAILAGNSALNIGVPHDVIHGCVPFRKGQCSPARRRDGSLSHTPTSQDTVFLVVIGVTHLPAISWRYFRPEFPNWWVTTHFWVVEKNVDSEKNVLLTDYSF